MKDLQFWRTWPRFYQAIGGVMALGLIGALAVMWLAYSRYPQPTFVWQHVQEQVVTEIPLRSFTRGPVELVIPADNYVIYDQPVGDQPRFYPVASYVLASLFFFSFSLLLAIITALSRFYYLAAMTGVIVLVTSLRLEVLQVFGSTSKWVTAFFLLLLVAWSARFQFFKKETSFGLRWLGFLLLWVIAGVLIYFFAGVEAPFLHLAVATLPVAIAATVFFIFLVAHEILAALVTAITRGFSPTHSLRHVVVISTIYLVNLALAYAQRFSMIDLDFVYIDFFLLLTLSGILGLWGFRQRRQQLESFLEEPFATLAYLAVAVVSFATLAFFWWSGNDPVLDAIGNLTIYAHLGFGLLFFMYVLSNFGSMLEKNLEVHKVLYKPSRMPYFSFRFAGVVATAAFVIYNGWQWPLHNCMSGFFNAAGDLYRHVGENKTALAFYQRGGNYGFLNHHSNYNIAMLERSFFNFDKERTFFNRASERRPTEMAVVNHAFTFQQEQNPLEALLALNEPRPVQGVAAIENMKGLLYKKLNLPDSAAHYFLRSARYPATRISAQMNLIGLAVEKQWPVTADTVLAAFSAPHAGVQSNALALANSRGRVVAGVTPPNLASDTALNLFTASRLHNFLINQIGKTDTAYLGRAVWVAAHPANSNFREVLQVAVAKSFYELGEVEKALKLMEQAIYFSSDPGKYNHIQALWALEQEAPGVAITYLDYAAAQAYPPAAITRALALAEAGRLPHAIQLWDSLQRAPDTLVQKLATRMVRILALPSEQIHRLTDDEQAAYVRFRLPLRDSATLFRLVEAMQSDDNRASALLDFSRKLFANDEIPRAIRIFQRIRGLTLTDSTLRNQIRFFDMALLAAQGNYQRLAPLAAGVEFPPHQNCEKVYYQAVGEYASGRMDKARPLFDWLGRSNPFYAPGITAAAHFFLEEGDAAKAYNVLAEALQRNPHSIKILKAYILIAAERGHTGYARSALLTLKSLQTPEAFERFLNENKNKLVPEL